MFASFASIIPSSINFNANKEDKERDRLGRERPPQDDDKTPRPGDAEQLQNAEGKPKEGAVDELGMKKRRERSLNETFIVVRPPPSVSNHPLNLQLQLVPPQAKERTVSGSSTVSGVSNISNVSNRRSVDFSAESASQEIGEPLARSASSRSNRSNPSSFYTSLSSASTASMSSIASSGSTSSSLGGRRMIVPLYNLSAHNVMTNSVLDAGTDAKVAKFHKRGLEILGLAVIECIEVWPSYGRGGTGHVTFAAGANGAGSLGVSDAGPSDALLRTPTPTSSAISLSSVGSHQPHVPTLPATPTKIAYSGRGDLMSTPTQSGAKKIFGKIFRKKDSQQSPASGGHVRTGSLTNSRFVRTSPASSDIGHGTLNVTSRDERSDASAVSPTPSYFPATTGAPPPGLVTSPTSVGFVAQPMLQPAILGIQPTLSAPLSPPAGRPTRYVWIVRKWLKGGDGGLLGGVMRGVGMVGAGIGISGSSSPMSSGSGSGKGTGGSGNGAQAVELRFEWVRGVSKSQNQNTSQGQKRRSTGQAAVGKRHSASLPRVDSETSLQHVTSRRSLGVDRNANLEKRDKSASRVRRANARTDPGVPRMSGESRRSMEHGSREDGASVRDSRSDSMTSTTLSEDAAGARQNLKGAAGAGGGAPQNVFDEEDEGEESDPEDSETPWTCTLIVSSIPTNPAAVWEQERGASDTQLSLTKSYSRPRSNISAASPGSVKGNNPLTSSATVHSVDSNGQTAGTVKNQKDCAKPPDAPGTLLRMKVGTLSPAPHHPKVVAQLKVPYPLPDIEVERARVRRRVLTPAGVSRPVSRAGPDAATDEKATKRRGGSDADTPEGTVLTAEEIKDVLSCTAFWVVVREGFGGVGKVNRKGDGWRIRG